MACHNVTLPRSAAVGKTGELLKPEHWGLDDDGRVWVSCPHRHPAYSYDGGQPKRIPLGLPHTAIIRYGPQDPADARARSWKIAADGSVTPSIWMMKNDVDCDWHVYAKLEGWPGDGREQAA